MTKSQNSDLRILISGGAGGVGLACATNLALHRPELILCDLNGTRLRVAARELGAFTRFCDATAEHSVAIFAAEMAQKFSSIDVLINAAGKGYARTLATMRMTRAFMPLLRRASGQRLLINIAPSARSSANGLFPYASSPTAFERLSGAIAQQARGSGIEVIHMSADSWCKPVQDARSAKRPAALRAQDNQYVADRVLAFVESARGFQSSEEFPKRRSGRD